VARSGLLTRAALLGASTALALAAASSGAASRTTLQSQIGHLRDAESKALLDLFAADAALARGRRDVARLERAAATQLARVNEVRRLVRVTGGNVTVAREALAERLGASYRAGTVDGLAVILSATSLSDAIDRAAIVQRVADEDAAVVADVSTALAAAKAAARRLGHARTALASALAAARKVEQGLADARTEKAALLGALRSTEHLARARIAALDAAAAAAQEKGKSLGGGTSPPPGGGTGGGGTGGGGTGGGGSGTYRVTAYSDHGTTATGIQTRPGVCATDPRVIPMGTRFLVPGYGPCVAADTGGDIKGRWIDVWFNTDAEASAWGNQYLKLTFP
jgi:3D (Asp-Asp-Asp) domain-containing protein/peptidoglycan hydrolase CwlO-like protein